MNLVPRYRHPELERVQWWALGVGVVTLLACVIGAPFSPQQFFRAYLAAYLFYWGLGLGSLAVLMLYFLTGGAWGFIIRRFLEAATRTLPLLAVLFTPVAYGIGYLYPWAHPDVVAGNRELQFNHIYLNAPFFWGRAALFFISWIAVASVLSLWSRRQDAWGGPDLPRKFRLLSGPSLVIAYGAWVTFASVDWVMSLQPTFHSTIFAVIIATGQMLSAHALALIVLAWLLWRRPLAQVISLETLNDLGNLLFTFLILWSYVTFFQLMLIWMANLPDEVIWYLPRVRGGWQWVAWALFVLHFAVPFFALLMRDVKRNPRALAAMAGLLLFMQLVFDYYQVAPAFPNTTIGQHWMDFLTPLGLGGIWLAYFLYQMQRFPLLPRHDLSGPEAAHLRHMDEEERAREEAVSNG
jgi:hypothetical protein